MDRPELIKWGSLAGIVGAVAFSVLWAAAILADGHWLFGTETLSELGGFRPGRCFFNTGVMVMGIMVIPLGAALYSELGHGMMGRISTAMFSISGVLLVGIGLFPINTGAPHTFFSWAFFSVVIVSLTLMFIQCRHIIKPRSAWTVSMAGVLIIAYGTIVLVALGLMELALCEALVVIALIVWDLTNAVLMLLKKDREVVLGIRR
ncbi:MAG: DUF998 domain-containing protein [Methanomassiliicoccales archaeon]|nr:DUF998 domain-containing protein [Methanomassiliicoccales archaeon]